MDENDHDDANPTGDVNPCDSFFGVDNIHGQGLQDELPEFSGGRQEVHWQTF